MRWYAIVCLLVVLILPAPSVGQTESVREAQSILQGLGFDPGPIDGFAGPKTASALSDFQSSEGLDITGTLDEATLGALRAKLRETVDSSESDDAVLGQSLSDSAISPERVDIESGDAPLQLPDVPQAEDGAPAAEAGERSTSSSAAAFAGMAALAFALLLVWRRGRRRRSAEIEGRATSPRVDTSRFEHRRAVCAPRSVQGRSQKLDCWIPASKSVEVSGLRIGGMLYAGQRLEIREGHGPENCLIDPRLKVARTSPDVAGAFLPYWPSYSDIDPRSRLAYLQWLSGGRKDSRYSVGYAFLFFYGLERRIVLERCDPSERAVLAEEVRRLSALYAGSRSFRRYSDSLLSAVAVLDGATDIEVPISSSPRWEVPFVVRLAIGRRIDAGEVLDANLLFAWWWDHPDTRPRTPATRALPEFRRLFGLRFAHLYPDGLRVPRPKRKLAFRYCAASDTFEVDLTQRLGSLPDVAATTAPIKIADTIAEACMEELSSFSRYLGRNPDGRGTLEGHALLPAELAKLIPSRELDELRSWAKRVITDQNGLIPVVELLARLEGEEPKKIVRRALLSAADALARLGIGMAPDPRYALRAPKMGEPVVLFTLPDKQTDLAAVSPAYPGALLAVTLGAFVAHADGVVTSEEQHRLERIVHQLDELSMAETARLYANLYWALAVPPSLSQLRRHLSKLSAEASRHLGRISIAVAGSDGHIDASEIDALRKLYRALGLAEDSVFADLNAIATPPARGPVTVRPASLSNGDFAIPPSPGTAPSSSASEIELDHDQIGEIIADTTRVSRVLGDMFRQDDPDEPTPFEEDHDGGTGSVGPYSGLDPSHRPLAEELASRRQWSQEEFDSLATRLGLMPGGALETLNEWAFDTWDEGFIEDDGDLIVNPEVLEALGKPGQGERHDAA